MSTKTESASGGTAGGYISDAELFHFCGRSADSDEARYDLLVGQILGKGALRHPPFTDDGSRFGYEINTLDGEWTGSLLHERQGPAPGKLIFENIICFCDIPRAHLALHMGKYSRFGLSFARTFVAERGGRPVSYFPYWQGMAGATTHGVAALETLDARVREMIADASISDQMRRDFFMKFVAFIKPFDAQLSLEDPDCYYTEREWRIIGYLNFAPQDVVSVNMPASFHARFAQECPEYAGRLYAT